VLLIGTKMIDLGWPWTPKTHSGALWCRKDACLEPTAQIWMKIDPYMQRQKCRPMTLSFSKYKVYADTRVGSSWRGPQMRVGLLTTAIFGNFSGYFFGVYSIDFIVQFLLVCCSNPATGCYTK